MSVVDALSPLVRRLRGSGDVAVAGPMDEIAEVTVSGVGPLSWPLTEPTLERLRQTADRAPYGDGQRNVRDSRVRRAWQLGADRVELGAAWPATIDALAQQAGLGLGQLGPCHATFYKLLIYPPGGHFKAHRDTEKAEGMFATLVVVLPSAFEGGEVVVRHRGRSRSFAGTPGTFLAFHTDCLHEIREIRAGHRIALVFHLCRTETTAEPAPSPGEPSIAAAADVLRRWEGGPRRVVVPLHHDYAAPLTADRLKNRDIAVHEVLGEAARRAGRSVTLLLAHHSVEEAASSPGQRSSVALWWSASFADPTREPPSPAELCPPESLDDRSTFADTHRPWGNEWDSWTRSYRWGALVIEGPGRPDAEVRDAWERFAAERLERRIARARAERWLTLDLSHQQLRTLPASLSELVWLEELDLSNNWIEEWPPAMAALTQLRRLDVSHNALRGAPDLSHCSDLVELDLGHNEIERFDARGVPPSLRGLGLAGVRVDTLALRHDALERLDLSRAGNLYPSVQLELDVTGLPELRELRLPGAMLTSVRGVEELPHLEVLDLSQTRVVVWPRPGGPLRELELRLAGLTEVPELPYPSLEVLRLDDNPLNELPELPAGLRSLGLTRTYLRPSESDASGGLLRSLASWTQLRELWLDGLPVPTLDLEPLHHLRSVSAVGCGIRELQLPRYRVLEELVLWGNALTELPETLSRCGDLVVLELGGNPDLEALPDLSALHRLRTLSIGSTRIGRWPLAGHPELCHLDVSDCGLTDVPPLDRFPCLESLTVAGNPELLAGSDAIERLARLVTPGPLLALSVARTGLAVDPTPLGDRPALQVLDLGHNPLNVVPPTVRTLPRLTVLSVEHCPIDWARWPFPDPDRPKVVWVGNYVPWPEGMGQGVKLESEDAEYGPIEFEFRDAAPWGGTLRRPPRPTREARDGRRVGGLLAWGDDDIPF